MPNVSVGINKSDIYLCKKVDNLFKEPKRLRFNVMPANSDAEIIAYGLSYPEYLRIRCTAREAEMFIAGDKIYFRKPLPAIHDKLQTSPTSANYEVTGNPTFSLTIGDVRLKRIPNR